MKKLFILFIYIILYFSSINLAIAYSSNSCVNGINKLVYKNILLDNKDSKDNIDLNFIKYISFDNSIRDIPIYKQLSIHSPLYQNNGGIRYSIINDISDSYNIATKHSVKYIKKIYNHSYSSFIYGDKDLCSAMKYTVNNLADNKIIKLESYNNFLYGLGDNFYEGSDNDDVYIYTVDLNNNFRVAKRHLYIKPMYSKDENIDNNTHICTYKIQHSVFTKGKAVRFAGSLQIVNGKIKYIYSYSGHYKPSPYNTYEFIEFIKNNYGDVFTDDAMVILIDLDIEKLIHKDIAKNITYNYYNPTPYAPDIMIREREQKNSTKEYAVPLNNFIDIFAPIKEEYFNFLKNEMMHLCH